jgi:hypothetical protein
MPEKTPSAKMHLKPGMTAALLHVPADVRGRLRVPDDVTVVDDPGAAGPAGVGFLLDFATTQAEAEMRLLTLRPFIGEKSVAWLAYPKGSKAAGRDLSRDTIWAFARAVGLTLVTNIAIDETWSALRIRPAADKDPMA